MTKMTRQIFHSKNNFHKERHSSSITFLTTSLPTRKAIQRRLWKLWYYLNESILDGSVKSLRGREGKFQAIRDGEPPSLLTWSEQLGISASCFVGLKELISGRVTAESTVVFWHFTEIKFISRFILSLRDLGNNGPPGR